ncbi:hypothetical protein C2S51_015971 [Perilla frutescens var. frutescens]|nr:hypothetical protein C2S51_015971 [Perilla frutescens var. frutescens]
MNTALAPPAQRRKSNIGRVPPEILELILLNLPMKSLVRFSTVSKPWNSMIFGSRFVRIHKSRAALDGREMIVTISSSLDNLINAASLIFRISLTSSECPIAIEDSTDLICPVEATPHLRAFCDELWLVEAVKSLFLWNHSMRTCRKLPDSLLPPLENVYGAVGFVYGLAYDSAADDYKILKIGRENFYARETELYSLKSNSWKNIPPPSRNSIIEQNKCEFVNGAFHWFCTFRRVIVCFNLSREKHGKFGLPEYSDGRVGETTEVVVLRGMLCVGDNYPAYYTCSGSKFVLWAMKEYGKEESWSKMLDIEYNTDHIPGLPYKPSSYKPSCTLRPLCFYDNGDILLNISCEKKNMGLFLYKNKAALLEKIVAPDRRQICGGFIYIQTLVSPWPNQN